MQVIIYSLQEETILCCVCHSAALSMTDFGLIGLSLPLHCGLSHVVPFGELNLIMSAIVFQTAAGQQFQTERQTVEFRGPSCSSSCAVSDETIERARGRTYPSLISWYQSTLPCGTVMRLNKISLGITQVSYSGTLQYIILGVHQNRLLFTSNVH